MRRKQSLFLLFILLLTASLHAETKDINYRNLSAGTQHAITLIQKNNGKEYSKEKSSAATLSGFIYISDESVVDELKNLGITINAIYGQNIVTAQIPFNTLPQLSQLPGVINIQVSETAVLSLDKAREDCYVDNVHNGTEMKSPFTGKGVIVGIVDCGFDTGHPAFFETDDMTKSRIIRFWDQNRESGTPPSGFSKGSLFVTQESILNAGTDNADQTHGTHVAGIAAGGYEGSINTSVTELNNNNPFYGCAPDASIVLVGTTLQDNDILDGIRYIFNYADSVNMPAVVNISINTFTGPHDGTSAFDMALDAIQGPGRIVVGAVGNENKNHTHTGKNLTTEETSLKTAFVTSGASPKVIEAWGGAGTSYQVTILFQDKISHEILWTMDASPEKKDNIQVVPDELNNYKSGNVSVYFNRAPNSKLQAKIIFTDVFLKRGDIILEIQGEPQRIDLWTDKAYGTFSSMNMEGLTDYTTDYVAGELGGTGKKIISVGNYTTRNKWINFSGKQQSQVLEYPIGQINYFSSQGPTTDDRMKPDISAPGGMMMSAISSYYSLFQDNSANTIARCNKNDKNYYFGQMTGTSMASPFVTGIIATWLQASSTLSPDQIKEILDHTAKKDNFTGPNSNNTYGRGKIDAWNGIKYILEQPDLGSHIDKISRLSVYPTHISDNFRILSANEYPYMNIYIYNLNGILVYNKNIKAVTSGSETKINTSALSSGSYIVNIITPYDNQTYRIIKK